MHLRMAGVPTASVEMNSPDEIRAEMFKWEIGTALACAPLNVNPFYEPDVQESRARVSGILEKLSTKHEWPVRTARVREKGIELYAAGDTRLQISTRNLSEALRTFLEAKQAGGYLAVIAFASGDLATSAALGRLRGLLASYLGVPILVSLGPRYLRNFEQVYKGGPRTGLFLILTSDPAEDIGIPGAGHTFGQLQLALALGEFKSLVSRRMLTVQLHFTQGLETGLAEVEQVVQKF